MVILPGWLPCDDSAPDQWPDQRGRDFGKRKAVSPACGDGGGVVVDPPAAARAGVDDQVAGGVVSDDEVGVAVAVVVGEAEWGVVGAADEDGACGEESACAVAGVFH